MIAKCAKRLACGRKPYAIELDDGQAFLPAQSLSPVAQVSQVVDRQRRAIRTGIYHGATFVESQLCLTTK
jgi:hypothetical protein